MIVLWGLLLLLLLLLLLVDRRRGRIVVHVEEVVNDFGGGGGLLRDGGLLKRLDGRRGLAGVVTLLVIALHELLSVILILGAVLDLGVEDVPELLDELLGGLEVDCAEVADVFDELVEEIRFDHVALVGDGRAFSEDDLLAELGVEVEDAQVDVGPVAEVGVLAFISSLAEQVLDEFVAVFGALDEELD